MAVYGPLAEAVGRTKGPLGHIYEPVGPLAEAVGRTKGP